MANKTLFELGFGLLTRDEMTNTTKGSEKAIADFRRELAGASFELLNKLLNVFDALRQRADRGELALAMISELGRAVEAKGARNKAAAKSKTPTVPTLETALDAALTDALKGKPAGK